MGSMGTSHGVLQWWGCLLLLALVVCFHLPAVDANAASTLSWTTVQSYANQSLSELGTSALRLADMPQGSAVTVLPLAGGTRLLLASGSLTAAHRNGKADMRLPLQDTIGDLLLTGSPSHFTVDLGDLQHASGAIHIGSAFDEALGRDLLVVRSDASDFAPILVECEGLETLTVVGGGQDEEFVLGRLPEAFGGAVHIEGGGGEDTIDVVEEQRDYNGLSLHDARVTVHKAMAAACPVVINTPTTSLNINSPCTCGGTDDITITVRNLIVSPTGSIVTSAGDITLTVPTALATIGVAIDGDVQSNAGGDITINGAGMTHGIVFSPTAILTGSGDVTLTGIGGSIGVYISGTVTLSSAAVTKVLTIDGIVNLMNLVLKHGVFFDNVMMSLTNYDADVSGTIILQPAPDATVAVKFEGGTVMCDGTANVFSVTGTTDASGSDMVGGIFAFMTVFSFNGVSLSFDGDFTPMSSSMNVFGVSLDTVTATVDSLTINGQVAASIFPYTGVRMNFVNLFVLEDFTITVQPSMSPNTGNSAAISFLFSSCTAGRFLWTGLLGTYNQASMTTGIQLFNSDLTATSVSQDSLLQGRGAASSSSNAGNQRNNGIEISVTTINSGPRAFVLQGTGGDGTHNSFGLGVSFNLDTSGMVSLQGYGPDSGSLTMPNHGFLTDSTSSVTILSGSLAIVGEVLGTGAAASGQHGILLVTNSVIASNSPSFLSLVGTGGSGGSARGVQWSGLINFFNGGQVNVMGTGGIDSGEGVFIEAAGSFPGPTVVSVVGQGGGLTAAVDNNVGIVITNPLDFQDAMLTLTGTGGGGVSSVNNIGVSLPQLLTVGNTLTIEGTGSTTAGGPGSIGQLGVLIQQGISSSLGNVVISGERSLGTGHGILVTGPITAAGDVTLSGTSTGGGFPAASGVRIEADITASMVEVTGVATNADILCYGVNVGNAAVTITSDTTILFDGTASGPTEDSIGVLVESDVTLARGTALPITATVRGSSSVGFRINGAVLLANTGVTLTIDGTGSSEMSQPFGVFIGGAITASEALTIDGVGSSNAVSDAVGVRVENAVTAPSVTLNGNAGGPVRPVGVSFRNAATVTTSNTLAVTGTVNDQGLSNTFGSSGVEVETPLFLASTATITGTNNVADTMGSDHVGVRMSVDVTMQNLSSLTVAGVGGLVNSGGIGVLLSAPISMVAASSTLSVTGTGRGTNQGLGVLVDAGFSANCPGSPSCMATIVGTGSVTGSSSPGVEFAGVASFDQITLDVTGLSQAASQGIRVNDLLANTGPNDLTMTATCTNVVVPCFLLTGLGRVVNSNSGNVVLTGNVPGTGPAITFQTSSITYPSKVGGRYQYDGNVLYLSDTTYSGGTYDVRYSDELRVDTGSLTIENAGAVQFGETLVSMATLTLTMQPSATANFLGGTINVSIGSVTISRPMTLMGAIALSSGNGDTIFLQEVDGSFAFTATNDLGLQLNAPLGATTALQSVQVTNNVGLVLTDDCVSITTIDVQQYDGLVVFNNGLPFPAITFTSTSSTGSLIFIGGTSDAVNSAVRLQLDSANISWGGGTAFAHRGNTEFSNTSGAPGFTNLNAMVTNSPTVSFSSPMTVSASGTYRDMRVLADVIFSPGALPNVAGCVSCINLFLEPDSTLDILIGNPPAVGVPPVACINYDRVSVTNQATISAPVMLDVAAGTMPATGVTYDIVVGSTTSPMEFANLSEGDFVVVNGVAFSISYTGAAGADVVLVSNGAPVAVDDMYTVNSDPFIVPGPGLLVNDFDPENTALSVATATGLPPTDGMVNVLADGSFTYTPMGFVGTTSFMYTVTDGFSVSAPAEVTLIVLAPSPSPTPSNSPSRSMTSSASKSSTGTPTPAETMTATQTQSSTQTAPPTPTSTRSLSSTPTGSVTPTETPSSSMSATPSPTKSMTGTSTATDTGTPTPSSSTTPSATLTPSSSASETQSPTVSPSTTRSAMSTMTASLTRPMTASSTTTPTPSASTTKSATATPTVTVTPTFTPSTTRSVSTTASSTVSAAATGSTSVTATNSGTATGTPTVTASKTNSGTMTPSRTAVPTASLSKTKTVTPTGSGTPSPTPSSTVTSTGTPTATVSLSSTVTPSTTLSKSSSMTGTPTSIDTPQSTPTAIASVTPEPTVGASASASPTLSGTSTATRSASETSSSTGTTTTTASATATATSSETALPTPSGTATATASLTSDATPSPSSSQTESAASTPSATKSITASPTPLSMVSSAFSPSKTPGRDSTPALPPVAVSAAPSRSPTATISVTRTVFAAVIVDDGTVFDPTLTFGNAPNGSPIANAPDNEPLATAVFIGGNGNQPVSVRDARGTNLGTVIVPDEVTGELIVTRPASNVILINQISSSVIDINVRDTNGEAVTSFNDNIEVCLTGEDVDEGDVCLGFFNDDQQWECQDYCLSTTDGQLCGKTDHLTNFALLLDPAAGSDDKCGSSSADFLLIYLSIAAVAVALLVIAIFVVLIEVKIRITTWDTQRSLTTMKEEGGHLNASSFLEE